MQWWRYEVAAWRFAWKESRDEIRGHMRSAIAVLVASLVTGGYSGLGGGAPGVVKGAVGLAVLAAGLLFLSNLAVAPAKMHALQEARIATLTAGAPAGALATRLIGSAPRAVVRVRSVVKERGASRSPVTHNTLYFLEVTNTGSAAVFHATQETPADRWPGGQRMCRWTEREESHVVISNGEMLSLIFVEYEITTQKEGVRVSCITYSAGDRWIPRGLASSWSPAGEPVVHPNDFKVVVRLFSEPDLAEPVVITATFSGGNVDFDGVAP